MFKNLKLKTEAKPLLFLVFAMFCWGTYFITPLFSFFFFIPIFYVLNNRTIKDRFFILFYQFLIFNLIASYWLINVDFMIGLLVHSLNGLGMFLTTFLAINLSKYFKINISLTFISCWIFYEQLHQIAIFSWPWLSLGNVILNIPFYNNFYNLFGSLSGSIVILNVNYFLYLILFEKKYKYVIHIQTLMICIFSYGIFSTYANDTKTNASINAKAVIPNKIYSHSIKEDFAYIDSSIFKERLANNNTLIIMPENVLADNIWNGFLKDSKMVNTLKQRSKIEKCKGFVFGTIIKSDRKKDKGLGNHIDPNFRMRYSEFGASIFVDSFSEPQVHLKRKLVPKEEFLPSLFYKFDIRSSKLTHGNDFNNIEIGKDKIVNLICYESFFGEDVAICVKDSGAAILMIANQQMFPFKYADEFYTNICKIRAIENNRYFLKISNMGLSCLIDPNGNVIAKSDDKKMTILVTKLPLLKSQTFYTKNTKWINLVYLLQPILLLFIPLFRFIKNKT